MADNVPRDCIHIPSPTCRRVPSPSRHRSGRAERRDRQSRCRTNGHAGTGTWSAIGLRIQTVPRLQDAGTGEWSTEVEQGSGGGPLWMSGERSRCSMYGRCGSSGGWQRKTIGSKRRLGAIICQLHTIINIVVASSHAAACGRVGSLSCSRIVFWTNEAGARRSTSEKEE